MLINVRNMVCRNCVRALHELLTELDIPVREVGLGYAELDIDTIDDERLSALDQGLAHLGFERIVDPGAALVEKVKHAILRHISLDEPCPMNLSHCVSEATNQDYASVSRIFSAVEGRTIEKFYVAAKIEKAKELLSYGDIPLSEIAYRLGYSSVQFLSRQFKQSTGMTPSQYRAGGRERRPLTDI